MATLEMSPSYKQEGQLTEAGEANPVVDSPGKLLAVANFMVRYWRFGPQEAPLAMSEHFEHAQKRNDPFPDIKN